MLHKCSAEYAKTALPHQLKRGTAYGLASSVRRSAARHHSWNDLVGTVEGGVGIRCVSSRAHRGTETTPCAFARRAVPSDPSVRRLPPLAGVTVHEMDLESCDGVERVQLGYHLSDGLVPGSVSRALQLVHGLCRSAGLLLLGTLRGLRRRCERHLHELCRKLVTYNKKELGGAYGISFH